MAETFNSNSVKLTTTNATDAYQAPNVAATDRAIVLSIMAANLTGSAATVTVQITDASNVVRASLAQAISVPANSTLEVVANKVVLKQGEKIRATTATANAFDVTVSALEVA